MPETPPVTSIDCIENGPYKVHGLGRLIDARGPAAGQLELEPGGRTALCRCGRSDDKPFCDGSHKRTDFEAPGIDPRSTTRSVGPGAAPATPGSALIRVVADGPYRLEGDFQLRGVDVEACDRTLSLCRCGGSSSKPLCDGSHARSGFADTGS